MTEAATALSQTTSILLSAVLILTACTSTNNTQLPEADFYVSPGQPFVLRVGDTAGVAISSAIVLVRFGGVLADSRCPVDATCIQAGAATLLLSVQTTLTVQDVQLDVPPDGAAEIAVEEVTIQALEVQPAAQAGVVINSIDYEVLLRVSQTAQLF